MHRGFTLVEMIVSVGLFALVMLVATSAYYNLIALDRQARAVNVVVDNLSFAVDAMTRGMRTGTGYKCVATGGNSTDGSCTCFSYSDTNIGKTVSYYFDAPTHTIKRLVGSSACSAGTVITDPSVTINSLKFYVRGVGNSDDLQPQALFTINGTMHSDNKGGVASFSIEENATQRLLDL